MAGRRKRRVDASRADREALRALVARSVPRAELVAGPWLSLMASSDLHPHGYTVRHWVRLADMAEVLEYLPRCSDLPRVTARTYAEQCEVHAALQLNIVPPGQAWMDYRQRGLFDDLLQGAKEAAIDGEQEPRLPDH